MNRHNPDIERMAEGIYAMFAYDGKSETGSKPGWVPHGNSLKQDEAREYAAAALNAMYKHTFGLDPEEQAKADAWLAEKMAAHSDNEYFGGAIGGYITYQFTPTSLGLIKIVHWCKDVPDWADKLDLTEYENW